MTDKYSHDTTQQHIYRAFEALAAGQDAEIDLTQAALLIASLLYPDLDRAQVQAQLDALAHRVRTRLEFPENATPEALAGRVQGSEHDVLEAIRQVLFVEENFSGNEEDYSNPENSFLNRVLERHTGIPITLSLLYIEVARRVGLHLDGIGLPFHFMVGCRLPGGPIYIDAFAGGEVLDAQACRERIRSIAERIKGNRIKLHSHWFMPVTKRQFLFRILNNLKHIYLHNDDYPHALAICDFMLILVPQSATERRERGLIHLQLKHYARALHDLSIYLELEPHAEDRYEVRNEIKSIRQTIAMMN